MSFNQAEDKAELSLYFIPSPKGMSWQSPYHLTVHSLKNQLTLLDRKTGHVAIELKIHHPDHRTHFLTGMTGDVSETKKLFIKGIGLGMLFHNFPGRLENHDELAHEIRLRHKIGRLSRLKISINLEAAIRLKQYFYEYKKLGHERNYGLPHRPLMGEGGGCTAFGMSFLELAGILEDEFKNNWSHFLNIPEHLIGHPVAPRYVNPLKLLTDKQLRWANDDEDHRKIFFWDPDKMHYWLLEKIKERQNGPYKIVEDALIPTLEIDLSFKKAPEGKIWLF